MCVVPENASMMNGGFFGSVSRRFLFGFMGSSLLLSDGFTGALSNASGGVREVGFMVGVLEG